MANIESKNLLVAVKSFARAQALPLDRDEVWASLSEAEAYLQSPTAYAGQTIKVLMQDGKYRAYTLQPNSSGLGLEMEEITGSGSIDPSQLKQYVQVVDSLPTENQIQGVIYINLEDNAGYIWTGTEYKQIFKDVETEVSEIEEKLESKAELSGATFTGEVILAADPTQDLGAVTKQYVDNLINNISTLAPGVVDSNNPLPTSYKAGQTWRVAELGIYAENACEIGDLIIAIADGESVVAENFIVVQANIDGAVTGPQESVDATLVVFDGTTGKKLAGSNVTISAVEDAIAKRHVHKNFEILESFSHTQDELENIIENKYEKRKYEVSSKPYATLVDYREKEIRIMCPSDTEWHLQNSGENAQANLYYIGFKAYAPSEAVSFKEDLAKVISDDTMYYFENNDFAGVDSFGRKYSIIWLPVAGYDNGTWSYYGANSTEEKFIGWYYSVEWYDENGKIIESDCIRINLSNENCHSVIEPFYVLDVKKNLQESIDKKIEATEMESAIAEAIEETRAFVNTKIGEIPEGTSVKQYIDNAIGSGGTDSAEAIAQAKSEAIAASKDYTDKALLIYEF